MKKFYSSLAAFAAAALVTASAAIPEATDFKKEPKLHSLDTPFAEISQKALDTFNSLATIESYCGPRKNILRATKDDILGKYVNLTTSIWNDNPDGVEGTDINIKEVNGEIIADNFLGLSGYIFTVPKGGPVATITADGKLSIKSQVIGSYTSNDGSVQNAPVWVIGYKPSDQEGYINLDENGEIIYTMDANGNMTSNLTPEKGCCIWIEGAGVAVLASSSKLIVPNGTMKFTNNKLGEYDRAVYVEKQAVDEFKVLFLSNVELSGGYGVRFDLEEDEEGNLLPEAYAVNQITSDADYDGYGPMYLCTVPLTSAGKVDLENITKTVEATLSNNNTTLTFNNTWSCCNFDLSTEDVGYWQNLNSPAVVNFNLGGAGVEDNIIAADNSNAPVEYYNLQGIRINEPAAGSVVIRRQGTEVSKILVK